ncbi:MAG: hypothetical protein QW175_06710 [Candidatus Bathyarchaeia archaeon]
MNEENKDFISSDYDLAKTKEELAEKINKPLPPLRHVVKLNFLAPLFSSTSLEFGEEDILVGIQTKFRLFLARKEVKQPPLIIVDRDGYVNSRQLEYCLRRIDLDTLDLIMKETPASIWKRVLQAHNIEVEENDQQHPAILLAQKNVLLTPVPRLRSVDFLAKMDWRSFVHDIVDFKGVEMDSRLKLIRLTHLMRGLRQSINPHALIVLPGQTGKSEWYRYVGVCEDKVSSNSLIGYADAEGPKPGSIDGTELPFALDQIESSGMYTIFRYMLGLMESGEARVDMAAFPFDISSQSVFAILSNPVGEVKSNFAVLLEKLSKNPSLGRRFGIILYDKEAVRIKRREKDMEKLREKVALFRAVEEYAFPELHRILNEENVWSWLNTRNEEFVKQALKAIEPIELENENLYLFLKEFIENGWSHIRGGALRASLALNLDKIALKQYNIGDLLVEAEEILTDLLKINYESIRLITATLKETKEEGDLRTFDSLPSYLKEIVSAVEHWRRSLTEQERNNLKLPLSFYLNTLNYQPESADYFSQIILNARKGNPEKYNETLKEHFGFELKKDETGIQVWVYSLQPISHVRILGSLGNLESLEGTGFSEKHYEKSSEDHGSDEKSAPLNTSKIPKIPKFLKPDCIAKLSKLSCHVIDSCGMCGFNGRMVFQADLKSGSWSCLCETCGEMISRLEKGD